MHELQGTTSFCELRSKEVINILDGRRLGRIVDVIFSGCHRAAIKGIVVPYIKRFLFFRDKEVFVPWHCVRKIGEDVILIELTIEGHGHDGHHRRKRRRYEQFDSHFNGGSGGGHGRHDDEHGEHGGGEHDGEHGEHGHGGGVHVHSVKQKKESPKSLDDDDDNSQDLTSRYKKPQFDLNKKAPPKKKTLKDSGKSVHTCDKKCEKCMLFDCENRWQNTD